MNFVASTEAYEGWLKTELDIVPADLKSKHDQMAADVFSFFRATFYRWSQLYTEVCADLAEAPQTLAVGDLHVENFGTWRDIEARLVWGINDFDEATTMPFAIDLVRLAASAHLAIDAGHLGLDHKDACAAILAGYQAGLESGGLPWVLGEKHRWLSELVDLRDPAAFWGKLDALKPHIGKVPKEALRGIERLMPGRDLYRKDLKLKIAHRVAGLGSLGRQRFVAIAEFEGARVCREAKALAPSAWLWAHGKPSGKIRYQEALDRDVRAHDPFVHLREKWIVRRLAPDCARVELVSVPKEKEKTKLLHAMGFETANLHVGAGDAKAILRFLAKREDGWLHKAESAMVKATRADWEEWRGHMGVAAAPAAQKVLAKNAVAKKAVAKNAVAKKAVTKKAAAKKTTVKSQKAG